MRDQSTKLVKLIVITLVCLFVLYLPIGYINVVHSEKTTFDFQDFQNSYIRFLLSFIATLIAFFLITVYWKSQEQKTRYSTACGHTLVLLSNLTVKCESIISRVESSHDISEGLDAEICNSIRSLALYNNLHSQLFSYEFLANNISDRESRLHSAWVGFQEDVSPKLDKLSRIESLFPNLDEKTDLLSEIKESVRRVHSELLN